MKKSLGKVRLYGGGDYTSSQLPMIIKVLKAFPKTTFYMISKEIRRYREDALQLLQFPNFFLNLSEANGVRFDLNWHEIKKHPLDKDSDHFLSEIGWREFSYYLLHHFKKLDEAEVIP